jgi:diguanylate cyclase (GGDEF)-like protein
MKISSICRRCYPFFAPIVVLLVSLLLTKKWENWVALTSYKEELKAISILLPTLPYFIFGIGTLLGWRFQKSGMMLAAWLLGLTYWLYHWVLQPAILKESPVLGFHETITTLILLELTIISLWRWRRLSAKWKITWLGLIVLQTILWAHFESLETASWYSNLMNRLPASIPLAVSQWMEALQQACSGRFDIFLLKAITPVTLIFMVAGIILVFRTYYHNDVLLGGFVGCICALWLGIGSTHSPLTLNASFIAAGLILIITLIEASFSLAYHDDLTGLPGRRSLNETLSSLGKRYTIAMIDVDHFKKFNDTYGHKTGDEVLKMISAHLQQMTGGAKAFRYGGEEFTAIFSGKNVADTKAHLEAYRKNLAVTPFIVRNKTRKKSSANNRKKPPGKRSGRKVYVTVSIGAAEPNKRLKAPQQVIKAADAALYRAKRSGRNCIKT